MTWLLIAILAYLFLAIVNVADKFIVEKVLPGPRTYAFLVSTAGLLVFLAAPWFLEWPGIALLLLNILTGSFFTAALLFLYRYVLKTDFGDQSDNVRARRTRYIPVVLSREEVDSVIANLNYPYDLVVRLLYGCGLRLFECLKLRVHNFNLDAGILTVHDGKGKKDRTAPLPRSIAPQIKNHISYVMELHQKDLDAGYAGAFVDGLLEKKYKNIGKELIWQWFFPAKTLTLVPEAGEYRRYHLHETHVIALG